MLPSFVNIYILWTTELLSVDITTTAGHKVLNKVHAFLYHSRSSVFFLVHNTHIQSVTEQLVITDFCLFLRRDSQGCNNGCHVLGYRVYANNRAIASVDGPGCFKTEIPLFADDDVDIYLW